MKTLPRTQIAKCTLGNRDSGFYDCYFADYFDGDCIVNIGSSRNYDEAVTILTDWRSNIEKEMGVR